MSAKKLHSDKRKAKIWCSVRVSTDTKKIAEGILKTANQKANGRKIKLDEVLQAGCPVPRSLTGFGVPNPT